MPTTSTPAPDHKPLVWFLVVVVAITALACAAGAYVATERAAKERADWLAFKEAHRCEAVAHRDGVAATSVMHDAKGSDTIIRYTTPSQTGRRCDDGVTRFVDD